MGVYGLKEVCRCMSSSTINLRTLNPKPVGFNQHGLFGGCVEDAIKKASTTIGLRASAAKKTAH